jgi:undecaprenyl-diphosphatase
MDVFVTRWINSAAGNYPSVDLIMIAITRIGVPVMVLAVVIQWWSQADRQHIRHTAASAGLSFLLGLAINQLILLGVHRVRPYDAGVSHLLIAPSADWSFPSDHATASFAVVVSFAMQRLPLRTLGLSALALLICWSRIYVGTHYLSDVLGGAFTGAVAALLVRLTYRENSVLDRAVTRLL